MAAPVQLTVEHPLSMATVCIVVITIVLAVVITIVIAVIIITVIMIIMHTHSHDHHHDHYHDDHDKKQVIGLAAVGLLLTILASIVAIMAQRKRWYHQRFPQTIFVNIFDIIFVHIEIAKKMVVASRQALWHIPIAR